MPSTYWAPFGELCRVPIATSDCKHRSIDRLSMQPKSINKLSFLDRSSPCGDSVTRNVASCDHQLEPVEVCVLECPIS
jgi:hypothetical protein